MVEEPKIISQKDFPEVIKCVNHIQVGQLAYPESDLESSSWIDTVNENYDTHIIDAAIQVQSELALKQAMEGLSFSFRGIVTMSSKKKPPINWFSDELNAVYSELDIDCKDMIMPLFLSNSYFDSWFREEDNKKLKERGYESYQTLFKKAYVHLLKDDDLTFPKMEKDILKRFPNITAFPLLLEALEESDGEKLLSAEDAKKEIKVFIKNAKKEKAKKKDEEGHEDQDVEGYEDQSVEAELGPTLFETAIGLILGVSLLVYGHSNDIINLNFNNLGIAQMFVQYGLVLLLVPFVCTIAFVVLFRSLKWLISKSSLGNNSDDVNNPRVFMYIIAWVLAHFLVNLFNKLTSFIVIDDFIDDPDPFFSMLLPAFFSSGIVILVYNFFNNLNMKKVMIYFYIGALLGIGAEFYLAYIISSTDAMLELPNADWEFIRNAVLHKVFLGSWERYANIIGPYVLYLFIVRYYYIKKPDRWY